MVLHSLPMPPSSNKIYATDFKTKRRFKSKAMVQFQNQFNYWLLQNQSLINKIKKHLSSIPPNTLKLKVHRDFYFPHHDLYYKNGKPKKMDVTNLLKAIDDSVFDAINIDDSFIFYSSETKIISDTKSVNYFINVT